MDLTMENQRIELDQKIMTSLDTFVFSFLSHLGKNVEYVIISGYIPILFGRTRGTEDVDLFIEKIGRKTFLKIYDELLSDDFYFLNPEDEQGLYEMLLDKLAIRAAKNDTIIPNIELKFIKDDIDAYTMQHKKELVINKKHQLYISPFEVEIPYKLYLGSEKDIADALYLFEIFKEYLDRSLLERFMKELQVSGDAYGIGF
jgi:hypothetical protein